MPAGYVIAQLKVTNPENYKEYVEKVTPLVKKFGGEFLVRAGEFQIFDGETKFPRIIILKFPSIIFFIDLLSWLTVYSEILENLFINNNSL